MLGEPQRAEHARRQRGVRIGLVMHGRCRAGEVEDDLGVGVQRLAHVPDLQVKMRAPGGLGEVPQAAGHEVVEADHLESLGEEAIGEVRAQEARGARHEHGPADGA
jgi:hypothetical protein